MSIVNGSLQVAGGNNAWHTTYAAEIPLARQIVLNTQTGQYKIGDGSTALSGLTYYGGSGYTFTGNTSQYVRGDGSYATFPTAVSSFTNDAGYLTSSAIGVTVQGYSANTTLLGNSTTGSGSIVLATSPTFGTDIITPIIYGSSASGGNLTIQSTSNATKGTVFFGASGTDQKHVFYVGNSTGQIQIRSLVGTLSQTAIYLGVAAGSESSSNYTLNWSGTLNINSQATTSAIDLQQGSQSRFTLYGAATSGSNPHWLINFPTSTGITASTETPDVLVNSKTKTWAAGAITTQRGFYWKTQTYAFASASTITNSYGLFVEAATAGTNATITNNYAAGFSGNVQLTSSTTLLNIHSTTATDFSNKLQFTNSTTGLASNAGSFLALANGIDLYINQQQSTGKIFCKVNSGDRFVLLPDGAVRLGGTNTNSITGAGSAFIIDANKNLICGDAAISTTATDGFLYVPTCAGTPTGVPTTVTGRVPIVADSTNNKLYIYSGGAWVALN